MFKKPVNSIDAQANTIKVSDNTSSLKMIFKDSNGQAIDMAGKIDYFRITKDKKGYYEVTDYTTEGDAVLFRLPDVPKGHYYVEVRDTNGQLYPADRDVVIEVRWSMHEGEQAYYTSYKESVINDVEPIIVTHMTENTELYKGEQGNPGPEGPPGPKGEPGGVTDQEVIDARGEYSQLGERLDDSEGTFTSQLNEKEQESAIGKIANTKELYIKTFDGADQPLHPSVYYNENGWAGEKFWMAYTPFPAGGLPYPDRWECPSIVSSSNGIDWQLPSGAPDPLIDLTPEEIENGDYFSDPAIVMNGDTMEVWYRKTNGANTELTDLYRMTSEDGISWSAPEMVVESQKGDDGIGAFKTMRSPQVFYDGNKYIAFYSLQGGTGIWRSETTDPSSKVWTNTTRLDLMNPPTNMEIWHLGMFKEDEDYHFTGYDPTNNAIQYFTSSDGVNFDFEDTILKTDGAIEPFSYYRLYQSVPVKVKNEWLLYSSGSIRTSSGGGKRAMTLFAGKELKSLVPIDGGVINRRKYISTTPFLTNRYGENGPSQKYYGTYSDTKRNRFSGYKMKFGEVRHAPIWFDQNRDRPIVHVVDDTADPNEKPPHVGVIYRNINTGGMWLSKGVDTADDWVPIGGENEGPVVNNQRLNVTASPTIDVSNVYRLVINAGGSTDVTNLTGMTDGQELWILNATSDDQTIKHGGSGSGAIKLKNNEDIILGQFEAISLMAVNSTWYQK